MQRHRCDATDKHRVYDTLVTTLDILQRYACEELRHNVHVAVDCHLLIALEIMVFEYAMLAEEVLKNPRIFVDARSTHCWQHGCKTKLLCDHNK